MSAAPITFRLSQLTKVKAYINALSVDLQPVHDKFRAANEEVTRLQMIFEMAKAAFQILDDEQAPARTANELARRAADKQIYELDPHFRGERQPRHMYHCFQVCALLDEIDRLRKEESSIPRIDRSEMSRASDNLKNAEYETNRIRSEITRAHESISRAAKDLPPHATDLDLPTLQSIASLTIDEIASRFPGHIEKWWPDGSLADCAGMIRGELDTGCDGRCEDGYARVPLSRNEPLIDLIVDDKVRHVVCAAKKRFDHSYLYGAVPPKFANFRVHSLEPYDRSPINEEVQRYSISDIPSVADLNGWLMLGPPGTSKSTYAASAIIDMLTFRMVESGRCPEWSTPNASELNFWRVKVPVWTREMEAFETRDFDDRSLKEPELTPLSIESATGKTGLSPILWIEELDKFNPTVGRLRNLYGIIDSVYEAGGTIIATANLRPGELKKLLGEPIYRRLSGENDPDGTYRVWDFFKMAKLTVADLQRLKKRRAEQEIEEDDEL